MRHLTIASLFAALLGLSSFAMAAGAAASAVVTEPVEVQQSMSTVNLNTADAATLQAALNGIGKAKADAIVAYREQHGSFASVDELLEIKGIGKALLERNREKLSIN